MAVSVGLHYIWMIGERALTGPDLVKQTLEKVEIIKERLKAAQDRSKVWADTRRHPVEFQEGEKVYLKVYPTKGVMRFDIKGILSSKYIGP